MAPLIGEAVRAHRPDVLLVSLGLIDLGFYTNAEQTAENVRAFVAGAREADPRIRMVLLPVIPNIRAAADPDFAEQVDRFNVLLAKAVADLDEPRSPILLASPPAGYDIHADTYDGTHPNADGGAADRGGVRGGDVGGVGGRTGVRDRNKLTEIRRLLATVPIVVLRGCTCPWGSRGGAPR